jgi:hypothetical protein
MTTLLAFSVLFATGSGWGGTPDGLPDWVEYFVLFPLAAVIVLFFIWLSRKKD